jgi:hypothetical protein
VQNALSTKENRRDVPASLPARLIATALMTGLGKLHNDNGILTTHSWSLGDPKDRWTIQNNPTFSGTCLGWQKTNQHLTTSSMEDQQLVSPLGLQDFVLLACKIRSRCYMSIDNQISPCSSVRH